ncbi:MAG: diguanylate cyclase [Candidatus Omnitrophota bacterium]
MREKKRILVVEDEFLISRTILHLLTMWGHVPLVVTSGAAAIEASRQGTLDLVLLDHSLPDTTAFQLIKHFKKDPLTAYLPVIVLVEKRTFRRDLVQQKMVPDDYLMKPIDPLELRLRIDMVLRRTEHQFDANSLTRLPGSIAIEKEIERCLLDQTPISVCYCDIDHFKSFNDAYGYHRGNSVLQQMARLLVQARGNETDLVGHIGGDDFIVLTTPDREEEFCLHAIQEFDRLMVLHYPEPDRAQGHLLVKNRMGKTKRFPLMSVSIAVVNNRRKQLESALHVSEIASEIKKFLKERPEPGSAYLVDRRSGDSKGKDARTAEESGEPRRPALIKTSKPLGQLLLERSLITQDQLEDVLIKHWRSGCRLGQVLLESKLIEPQILSQLISEQLGVPYVQVENIAVTDELKTVFSDDWLKENGVFPVEKTGTTLSLAMVNPMDRRVIQWVEKMTGCAVRPCLAMEQELKQRFEKLGGEN